MRFKTSKKQIALIILILFMLLTTGCGKIKDSTIKTSDTALPLPTMSVAATPAATDGSFDATQGYSDAKREISVIGLKEYKKLKTDKYTDKASNGKKYLVLFLKIRNHSNEKIYFNVNYLTAKLDGKKIENTFLLNEPADYPSIFTNIAADSYYGGFIVWEVPSNWKKLDVTYDGWKNSDGLSLTCTLSSKDLFNPEKYDASLYVQAKK